MQNYQHEVRWIVALVLFFLERDLILDTMFAVMSLVFEVLN